MKKYQVLVMCRQETVSCAAIDWESMPSTVRYSLC